MRFLKFDIYGGGPVGFFNHLMSLELAVGLRVLSTVHFRLYSRLANARTFKTRVRPERTI
jgi:hypothetical protein